MLIGRRGGPSVDVFANPSPTPEELSLAADIPDSDEAVGPSAAADELADVTLSPEQREILKTAEAFRPRAPIQFDTLVGIAPSVEAVDRAATHRKRVGRVITGLLALFILGGGAVAGVYNWMPVYSNLDAIISFDGLDRLGTDDARKFRTDQNTTLQSESVRQNAIGSLPKEVASPGFLGDPRQFATAIDADPKVRWPADRPTDMRLRLRSPIADKETNLMRLRAVGQAFIDAAGPDIERANALRAKNAADIEQVQSIKRNIATLNEQLEAIQQAGNQRPDPAKIASLTLDRQHAEEELRAVKAQRQELEAAEQRLSKAPAASELPPADVNAIVADAELTKFSAQLADLQKRGQMQKIGANEKSAEARKVLDATIAELQQDLQTAQKLQDNPELVVYVQAANRTFTQVRKLTEDLIQRQVNDRTQLGELKSVYAERLASRTADLLAKDADLKNLNDRLAIGTRQANAAAASGLKDDASRISMENALVKSLIAARTDLLAKDPVGEAMIRQIEEMIAKKEKSIQNDRANVDDTLTKAQDDFMKNGPAVEKLPAEQKALAAAIEQKLKAMNEARKAYDAASDSTQTEQAAIDKELKEQTTSVQLEITARKNDLAVAQEQQQAKELAARRAKELDDTRALLTDVRGKEQQAQSKLDASIAAVALAEKQRRDFSDSDTDRETKLASRQAQERSLQTLQAALDTRKSELARLIVPERKFDRPNFDEPDRRLLFASLAAGLVFVLLMIPIGWNLILLYREEHPHQVPADPAMPPTADSLAKGFDAVMTIPQIVEEAPAPAAERPSPMLSSARVSA